MDIKFDKLWELLEEKNISEKEFQKMCSLSDEELEMIKANDEHIDFAFMDRLCRGLKCNIGDLISHNA